MNKTLAIITPQIGIYSETFIRRHLNNLLPGNTVAISANASSEQKTWDAECPILLQNWFHKGGYREQTMRASRQLLQVVTRKFGWRLADQEYEPIWSAAKNFMKQHNVQIIMGEYLDLCHPWIKVAEELNIPFWCHAHGYDISLRLKNAQWRNKYLDYNRTQGIITMSHISRRKLIEIGIQESKIHVIPYGIDVPTEPPKFDTSSTIYCLAVGRMVPKKSPLNTLEAFRQARINSPDLDLKLDYIGDGELMPLVRNYINHHNLSTCITLHGSQPSEVVNYLMKKSNIFVQHSITDSNNGNEEGLPVAILEAMASGLPVVSTMHAGIPEAVESGVTGYLVSEGDTVKMAEYIKVLSKNYTLREKMGYAGWLKAKDCFSWHKERLSLLELMEIPISSIN